MRLIGSFIFFLCWQKTAAQDTLNFPTPAVPVTAYAVPKGYQTNTIDSVIYNKAMVTLAKYKRIRKKYTADNKTAAVKIFRKLNS